MKALSNIERIQLNNETLIQLLSLYECKGKEFYYRDLFERDHASFLKKTLESDVMAIAKILNLEITDARIKQWAKKDLVPKNKDEELLKNIKNALVRLQDADGFELLTNEVLDLGKMISKGLGPLTFKSYKVSGEGLIKKDRSRRDDLEELIRLFDALRRGKKHEIVQLITNLYIDILNMDILTNYNEIVGLILLYAMLGNTFRIYHYTSFFHYFAAKLEFIKQAIIQAKYNWLEGYAQTGMLYQIIIDILMSSYNEVETNAHMHEFEITLNKTNNIENTISKLSAIFSKEEIRKAHPNISGTTIDRTLKRLREEEKIMPLGKGRGSKWQKIDGAKNTLTGIKQMSIFED